MSAAPLECAGLTRTFAGASGPIVAVDDVTVTTERGTVTTIVGPSGSGKSTLLQMLAGLDRPDHGVVRIGGVETTALGDRALTRLRREHLGFVFQSYQLMPQLTAAQNIELPLRLAGRAPEPAGVAELVELLGLGDRLDHLPSELSGGQQQRVAIARALVARPEVVLADEPTGALDDDTAAEVMDLFVRASRERGQTFVIVTHDQRVVARADVVLAMAEGRLAAAVGAGA